MPRPGPCRSLKVSRVSVPRDANTLEDAMHGTPHIVSDVMTRTVVALGRQATFKDIVKTMQRWNVSAMPVL